MSFADDDNNPLMSIVVIPAPALLFSQMELHPAKSPPAEPPPAEPPPEPPPYSDQTVSYYPSFGSRTAIRFATARPAAAFAFSATAPSAVIFALHQYLLASSAVTPESGSAIYFAIRLLALQTVA